MTGAHRARRAYVGPDFAGQDSSGNIEGDQSHPDAHPASNLHHQGAFRRA